MKERLQKILARSGHGSRRQVETLIAEGRIRVNGRVAKLGDQADPATDTIEVDGAPIRPASSRVYLAVHKPAGYTTTTTDRHAARTVMELLPPGLPPHVLPVGRLDRDTEGLLIFTSDGLLAHRLAHPRYAIEKEYLALVRGEPDNAALERLRAGVELDGRLTAPALAERSGPPPGYHRRPGHTWLRIVIHEGRNRQVRRMLFAVGHTVVALVRVRVGPVGLGRLERGAHRALTMRELASLRRELGLEPERAPG